MKIRMGFVSNSSSSSFIVAFDKLPATEEEMLKVLFGPGAYPHNVVYYYDHTAPQGGLAKRVLDDLKDQPDVTVEEITEKFKGRYSFYKPTLHDFPNSDPSQWYGIDSEALSQLFTIAIEEDRIEKEFMQRRRSIAANDTEKYKELDEEERDWQRKHWVKVTDLVDKIALADAKEFVESNKGCVFRLFCYSDEDGTLSTILEHGGIFRRIPHVRISHH